MGKNLNRSTAGNIFVFLFLAFIGLFMLLPLLLIVSNSLKPLDEFFIFPPRIFVRNPTLTNFGDLFSALSNSWIPFTRYFFNSIIISGFGIGGHIVIVALASYPLAKHRFPGRNVLFSLVVLALMFAPEVTRIPNFLIMTKLKLIDTYFSFIIPVVIFPLGLFLMKQFMEGIPDSLLECARLEGAGEAYILWKIVMPLVKPAWLTLLLLNFKYSWSDLVSGFNVFVFSEEIKPLPYLLTQIGAEYSDCMAGNDRRGPFRNAYSSGCHFHSYSIKSNRDNEFLGNEGLMSGEID